MAKKILVIAPHNDDETIGVGATIAKHIASGDEVFVATCTSIDEEHPVMTPNKAVIRAETKKAMQILGVKEQNIIFCDLPNVLIPDIPVYEVNKVIYNVVKDISPDVMYIPFLYDLHKDHRDITYAAQVATRTVTDFGKNIKEIYMYETLSETHWNIDHSEGGFLPNVYNDVSGEFLEKKLQAIEAYQSQLYLAPNARSVQALHALAVFRGSIVNMHAAEAFMLVRKLS